MTIRNPDNYPADWEEIAFEIKDSNHWQCQACGRQCTRPGEPYRGSIYLLTVAHLDPFSYDADFCQLAPLCSPCHLRWDAAFGRYFRTKVDRERQRRAGQLNFFYPTPQKEGAP